jgi:predicted ATPase
VLETLLERIGEQPMLVIVTSRPDFVPAWLSRVPVETLVLNRLDDGEVAELVVAVGGGMLPAPLRRRIVERSDGVPLFAEELTKTILETVSAETESLPDVSLPLSLSDSLMARLDRSPAAKEVAQLGAVIGRSFSHELIAALTPLPEPALREALDQLVVSGLASRRGVSPEATYTFKHALLQNAAYESLLKSRRSAIHAQFVEALIAQEPGSKTRSPICLRITVSRRASVNRQSTITAVLHCDRSIAAPMSKLASIVAASCDSLPRCRMVSLSTATGCVFSWTWQ